MAAPRPSTPRDAALHVVRTLREASHQAFFAGGCVRDQLLGLEPQDFDVATSATPTQVQTLFPRSNAVGAAFGVVLVYHGHASERVTTEVATFRTDGIYADGRRPDHVTFTDAKHDAQRRDFTINGLFLDPLPESQRDPRADPDGVIDFVGGRADLQSETLRAIGKPEQRFGEDYLRMLRAVRFAARFGFQLEPNTAEAIQNHAPKLTEIARERIGDELRRMIAGPEPTRAGHAAELVVELGLDAPIFDITLADQATPSRLAAIHPQADYAARLLAWLGPDVSAPDNQPSLRAALALSNDERDDLRGTHRLLGLIEALLESPAAQRKRSYAHPRWPGAMQVARAGHVPPERCDAITADHQSLAEDGIGLAPPPLISGDDLIATGQRPGPDFKTTLDAVYDAQLEGRVRTKSEALALVQNPT